MLSADDSHNPKRLASRKDAATKIGMRKPSVRKSFRARTTGKAKRKMKKAVNQFYGKRGMGFVKSPKKSVRAAVYRRATFSVMDLFRKHGR